MRLLVLSDTHVSRDRVSEVIEELREHLATADRILHAGDMVVPELIDALAGFAPVDAVAGNMDGADVHARFPGQKVIEVEGVRIGLVHGWGSSSGVPRRVLDNFSDEDGVPIVDVIVFGHTHKALVQRTTGVLLVNPGSPTDRHFAPYRSLALLEIGSGEPQAEIVRL
jgi:putative phosphoesterase